MTEADNESAGEAMAQVLIVDRHDEDREKLRALLAEAGFEVAAAATEKDARKWLSGAGFDAAIVDPNLPDGDGHALVRELARDGNRIVIVVGAGEDEGLPERAYANGAADFTYKPIVRNDLIARLRKAMRDRAAQGGASARLKLRREERVCTIDGCEIALTRHERDFLACLIDAPRGFASYGELIEAVWGKSAKVETQYLRVLAAQVRRKIERDGGGRIVVTVVGEGYRLNV